MGKHEDQGKGMPEAAPVGRVILDWVEGQEDGCTKVVTNYVGCTRTVQVAPVDGEYRSLSRNVWVRGAESTPVEWNGRLFDRQQACIWAYGTAARFSCATVRESASVDEL
jgi:hypothetical protein